MFKTPKIIPNYVAIAHRIITATPHSLWRAKTFVKPFVLMLLLLTSSSYAANNLTENQQAFLDAYQAIKANDRPSIAKYKAKLKNYELNPYLLYHDYRLHFKSTPHRLITQFIEENQNNYLGDRLYVKWLTYLGTEKQWNHYLKYYKPQQSRDLQCYHTRALAQNNKRTQAISQAQKLWVDDDYLSKACLPIAKLLKDNNKITGSMIWERIGLAMQKGRTSLAQTISKDLSKKEQKMFQTWLAVYKNPALIEKPLDKSISAVVKKQIFTQGIERLTRKEPEQALQTLERFHKQYGFSNTQYNQMKRSIALRTAYRYQPEAEGYLKEVNGNGGASEESLRWQAQIALKTSNWQLLLDTIALMDKEQQTEKQWQYWKARALAATGDEKPAIAIYQTLAKQRNYYAFLAADILKKDYQFNPDPVKPIDSAILIKKYPQLQRMQELLAIDWLTSAKREWYNLLDKVETDELHAVAILTNEWKQYSMAITTAARAKKWNDLSVRFPIPHQSPVMQSADKHGVDPAWIYGVIRRESAFSEDIQSSAGAVGLMQLMPQTAKYIGRKIGIKRTPKSVLTQPKSNIELGSAYLAYLHKKYDGNKVLATASYNAGPKRVDSWIPKDHSLPADQWVDSIPFSETRAYVKAVLEYTTIFKSLLNKKYDRLHDVMPPIGQAVASK
ncbi:MAG: transglycosylase SLT domain-containing protein [Thiotrichales bacterium]|nr:transglycosylase SLT domain-containing protein [Thiotrichales bacterium]